MPVIDRISGQTGVSQNRRARGPATVPFSIPDQEPASIDAAPATSPAAEIVAAYEPEETDRTAAAERDAVGQRLGTALLNELGTLQRNLLIKENYAVSLERLNALLTVPGPSVSPDLAAVLGAVRLRARVELARHGQ